jgi:hypothetical protein
MITVLIALVVVPWLLVSAFNPLQPPELAETVTAYYPTEHTFLTQDVQREFDAPSVMSTLPPEEFDDPLPPEGESIAQQVSYVAQDNPAGTLAALQSTIDALTTPAVDPVQMTMTSLQATINSLQSGVQPTPTAPVQGDAPLYGTANNNLELYRCPDSDQVREGSIVTGTRFPILAYSIDFNSANEDVYFLTEHRSGDDQVWVKFSERAIGLERDYRDVFQRGLTCGSAPVITRLEITPPGIATTTPLPPVVEVMTVTQDEAREQISRDVPQLRNPNISIVPEKILITGLIDITLPLGVRLDGDVLIEGELVQEGTSLRVNVTSIIAAGRDETGGDAREQVENAINQWLVQLLVQRDVLSFSQTEGVLSIVTLRYFSARPTANPSEIAPMTATPAEPTVSRALIVATATPDMRMTVTLRVATATPQGTPDPTAASAAGAGAARAVVTNSDANSRTGGAIGRLNNPNVSFDDGLIRITGDLLGQGVGGALGQIVPGADSVGLAQIIATPINQNGRLALANPSLILGGVLVDIGSVPGLEAALNAWLGALVPNLGSGTPSADNGVLSILGG